MNNTQNIRNDDIKQIVDAFNANRLCSSGILRRENVAVTANGYNGKEELLVLLYAGTPYYGSIYGHIFYEERCCEYLALLVNTTVFIDADDIDDLFVSFNNWVRRNGEYRPLTPHESWQTYGSADSFAECCELLARMVKHFDPKAVIGDEEDNPDGKLDMRSFSIYGCVGWSDCEVVADDDQRKG